MPRKMDVAGHLSLGRGLGRSRGLSLGRNLGRSHAEETGAWNHSGMGSGKETPQEAWSFVRSVFVSPAITETIFACTEKGVTMIQSSWPPKSWLNDKVEEMEPDVGVGG